MMSGTPRIEKAQRPLPGHVIRAHEVVEFRQAFAQRARHPPPAPAVGGSIGEDPGQGIARLALTAGMDRRRVERQPRRQREGLRVAQPAGAVEETGMLAAAVAFEMQPPDLDLLLAEGDNGFGHQKAVPSSLS
jgi:hypothetical protein